jgi:hypothetical protein
VGVVLVMLSAVVVLVRLLLLAVLLSPEQEVEQLGHGALDEQLGDVRILDLHLSLGLDGLPDGVHALLALHAHVGEVRLVQLQQVQLWTVEHFA